MKKHHTNHRGHPGFRRAMRARRWMKENPTNEEIISMLEEYQRDLEEEVATTAERVRRLKDEVVSADT